eukprot:scaffold14007_cov142-Isochrysis_galbana.AAC.2
MQKFSIHHTSIHPLHLQAQAAPPTQLWPPAASNIGRETWKRDGTTQPVLRREWAAEAAVVPRAGCIRTTVRPGLLQCACRHQSTRA